MGEDRNCFICGYWRGTPNTYKPSHKEEWVFICNDCKREQEVSE